jgi:benzylsuccinate CoA-transferase BbsF subunit
MALNLLADLFLKESLEAGSVHPQGNRSSRGAPWGVYPCQGKQRWCVITCRSDSDWQGLLTAMGQPDWAQHPDLTTVSGRRLHQDMIDERISSWTSPRSDREVMTLLQAQGVPAGMMMYMSDQPEDPHLRHRGYVLELDQPGVGPILLEGAAFHATRLPEPVTAPAPFLGQHTREICVSLLGYSEREVDLLVEKGLLTEASL